MRHEEPTAEAAAAPLRTRARHARRIVPAALALILCAGGSASEGAPGGGDGAERGATAERSGSAETSGAHDDRRRLPGAYPLRRDPTPAEGHTSVGLRIGVGLAILSLAITVVLRLRRSAASAGSGGSAGPSPWSRWLRSGIGDPQLRLLSSTRLTARASVHLVEWKGRELLIGCSDGAISLLASAAAPAPEPGPSGVERSAEGGVSSRDGGR